MRGLSILVASGDIGACGREGCGLLNGNHVRPNFPASMPYATSVPRSRSIRILSVNTCTVVDDVRISLNVLFAQWLGLSRSGALMLFEYMHCCGRCAYVAERAIFSMVGVVQVGGTDFASDGTGPEMAWWRSGGGFSNAFSQPGYQQKDVLSSLHGDCCSCSSSC